MKIIFLKSKINTLFLFLLLTHSLFGQETTGFKEKPIESTTKHRFSSENTKTDSSRLVTLAPNATISGNLSICLPGSNTTQLTGPGTPDPTTPWTSSDPTVATISNTGLVTAVGFGFTTITYRDNIGNLISENVYVSTFPTISSPSGTFTACDSGGSLQLNGSIFANATTPWESTNTAIATVDNTGLVTGVSGGIVNILYRNLGGCTVLQPVTIKPSLSPTLICGAITYNQVTVNWPAVTGASTYNVFYKVNGGGLQFGTSGNIFTWTKTGLLPGDSVEIFVRPSGTVGSCFTIGTTTCSTLACTPASTPVAPTITPTQPTCTLATGSVTITGVTGETYSFDGGAYSSTLVYSGLTAGSSHTVTAKNAVGCISSIANITLNAQPATPASPTLTPTEPTCTDASGSVTITGVAGLTYSFDGDAYSSTLVYSGLTAGSSHTVTAKNAVGCISSIANITLNAQPATPASPTLTPTEPTCTLATGSVTITGITGETYSFDGGAYSSTLVYSGLPASSLHTVTAINAVGCISPVTTITLSALPIIPAPPTIGTTTQPTCALATGSVDISALPTGNWTLNQSGTAVNSIIGNGATTTVSGLIAGNYSFTVTYSDGCSSAASEVVTINPQPQTPSVPLAEMVTQPTCIVATGSFAITNFDLNATYTFTPSSGVTVSSTGIVTALSGTYTSTASINGCTSATSVSITIDSQPITPAAPTGASTQTLEAGATLNSIVVTGINIQWYASTSSSNPLPNNTLLVNGTTYFASQNVNGCEGPRLAITVQTLLGINDFNSIKISFSPNPVTNFLDIKSNEILKSVSIMNALGQIVYFKNFNNTDMQLDLSDLSAGNYFVKAQSGERQHVFKIIKK